MAICTKNIEGIVGITPFETPNVSLIQALIHAGATGILDLGRDFDAGILAMNELADRGVQCFGVRISDSTVFSEKDLPPQVTIVIIEANSSVSLWKYKGRRVWVQVSSLEDAKRILTQNPDGLILKGLEGSGLVGPDSSFILLQQFLQLQASAEAQSPIRTLPFWVQGGIGVHSAAACIASGARGVVLDSQLSLFKECTVPEEIKKVVLHADGTETKVIHGYRIFNRPDLKIPQEGEISIADFKRRLAGFHLKENFLPVGQDFCLARSVFEKYGKVRTFVLALKRSIRGHLRSAKALSILDEGSAMASAYGIRFPLAQGPMTRVSDRAEFIDAVATNGALPFLALSLMNAEQSRAILSETKKQLGSKPWGVGILGFAPEELQKAQWEVLADFNPKAVLIAGGRPSQAEVFEKRGISTFLHVPSPGLLKQFLKEGARRFVFEGRECGGHVGPRTSFLLWELQIEILLGFEAVHEVEVFFAGGIHDQISAAMVAVMAAPLAARGAKIGVLIGTAYLFTTEAVVSGAIVEQFQKEALQCERTVLLESAPGHVTRCAESPFVEKFENKKKELHSQALESTAVWAELESLNVGRLRVASKGQERREGKLVALDLKEQREEGLFMMGQVASLRNKVCSMLALHEEISFGSTKFLENFVISEEKATGVADVAIVGMACIFPGAKNLDQFWKNVLAGKDLITEVPEGRWSKESYFEENTTNPNKSLSKWGGFIEDSEFDPLEFGIPPNSIPAIEPVQILSLLVAKRALADAGYEKKDFDRERTSVIFGAEAGTDLAGAYGFRALYPQFVGPVPKELDSFLPSLSEDSFPGVLANVIAGRIANRLDLGGSNFTVDAACASSIAALDLSIKELAVGESDMVLCGGADLHNSINDYLMFSSVHALSPTGKSQPFSARANGIVLGEGVAVVVLKRLSDAIRDQDRIYSVIAGVGSSSDGKSLGLTAPRKEGQIRALNHAYERAGINPSEIELIEAHGTGTVVGDRTELESMMEVFSEAGSLKGSCALGSVKSQIGHSKCAAGLAGVIKSSMAIYHGIIPPTLHMDQPNPSYKQESSPFYFTQAPVPWLSANRKAAVSAFGFGGTNFHAVLAAAPAKVENGTSIRSPRAWSAELFVFATLEEVRDLLQVLGRRHSLDFSRLACSLPQAKKLQTDSKIEIAFVARDFTELETKLNQALKNEVKIPPVPGKIAFLFSGQGSQSINMGAELFHCFPELRKYLDLGSKWTSAIYPKGIQENSAECLKQTRITQPALGLIELAIFQLTKELGIAPDFLAGHSYGELMAFCAAGSISEVDILPLSEARGMAMEMASHGVTGAMAAIFSDIATTKENLKGLAVVVANHNAPEQVVISGEASEVERAILRFVKAGIRCQKIAVSQAFHSPLMAKAETEFTKRLAQTVFQEAKLPVYSNLTGGVHARGQYKEALAAQMVQPVQFVKEIEAMYEDGARIFLEIGPNGLLRNLVGQILKDKPHFVQTLDRAENAIEQLLATLSELAMREISLKLGILFDNRGLVPYDLEKLKTENPSQTLWLVNGHYSKPKSGKIPLGGLKPGQLTIKPAEVLTAPDCNRAANREGLVKDYLQSMRQMVESQKQVMLQYLGSQDVEPTHTTTLKPLVPVKKEEPVKETVTFVANVETDIGGIVLQVVSQKTGYPEEMLGLDQSLEADLSIDSIKRVEILAEIGERLGNLAAGGKTGSLDKLSSVKTLRQWITTIKASIPATPDREHDKEHDKEQKTPVMVDEKNPAALPVGQYLFKIEDAPMPKGEGPSLQGKSYVIIEDQKGLSRKVQALLLGASAKVQILSSEADWVEGTEPIDGLILLNLTLDHIEAQPLRVFKILQMASKRLAKAIIGVTGRGGEFGYSGRSTGKTHAMGISGLFKSLAKEDEKRKVKVIDLDLEDRQEILAMQIFAEIQTTDSLVEVGYENGVRKQLVAVPLLTHLGDVKLELDRNSVILMLGGARGIAAKIAIKMAAEYGCRFEIVGRSTLPTPESTETLGIPDLQGLRAHFIKISNSKKPSEIEMECKRILQNREILSTLAQLETLGSKPGYHSFDVRNKKQLGELIDTLYTKNSIDGVIHAAGVLSDSLLLDKKDDDFSLVFETKVNPAEVLAEKLRDNTKFVALFSSVSGCFGNRGQTDYSSANNAMDQIARNLGDRLSGRTVSFNWGPWAETGMVTPELEKAYRKQGIGLIPPEIGAEKFLNELKFGDRQTRQVVIMSGSPESFK